MKHIKTQLKTKHKTRDGIISKISDLTTSHLHNIIKFWTWRAHRGVTIKYPPMDDGIAEQLRAFAHQRREQIRAGAPRGDFPP